MTDIALQPGFDGRIDIQLQGGDLVADDGLRTAVVLSLLTDRRANPGDALPDGSDDRRGWWADILARVEGDRFGSRLWLLSREKNLAEVRRRAETYAAEALEWLREDGIANTIEVEAETVATDRLGMKIRIIRTDGQAIEQRFNNLWESL
ncbi:phage GP46 family protein [Marinobacter sp. OP 3.4]|uniref:phage GP46 family protein n=1 Tax=Marinobacter sp. OP 3.4 TaxID=3076501 RepID=UPI002E1D0B08